MESSNAIMIRDDISQSNRLKKLNEYALVQLKALENNASINKLKALEISKIGE